MQFVLNTLPNKLNQPIVSTAAIRYIGQYVLLGSSIISIIIMC